MNRWIQEPPDTLKRTSVYNPLVITNKWDRNLLLFRMYQDLRSNCDYKLRFWGIPTLSNNKTEILVTYFSLKCLWLIAFHSSHLTDSVPPTDPRKAADSYEVCRFPNPCLSCILSDYNKHSTVTESCGIDHFSILSPLKKLFSLHISDNLKSNQYV